jgi:hypothetical protein
VARWDKSSSRWAWPLDSVSTQPINRPRSASLGVSTDFPADNTVYPLQYYGLPLDFGLEFSGGIFIIIWGVKGKIFVNHSPGNGALKKKLSFNWELGNINIIFGFYKFECLFSLWGGGDLKISFDKSFEGDGEVVGRGFFSQCFFFLFLFLGAQALAGVVHRLACLPVGRASEATAKKEIPSGLRGRRRAFPLILPCQNEPIYRGKNALFSPWSQCVFSFFRLKYSFPKREPRRSN